MNILELLKPSDKTALIQNKKQLSYQELLEKGTRFGGRLQQEGIGMNQYVLIFIPLSSELYIAMIGAWSVGAIPIFIDFSRGAKFVDDSIERLKPDVIVCDSVTGMVRKRHKKMRQLKAINIKKSGQPVAVAKLNSEHPAILTFTSGTTGFPKVAVRSHGFLINQYHVLSRHLNFAEHHIDLGTLPVFTLANLAANMTTLLPDKSYQAKINPKKLAIKAQHYGVTRAICAPVLIENVLKHGTLPNLENVYLGGAPVYPSVLEKIRKDVDVNIVYGSTEAEPIASICWADVTGADRQKIANGAGLLVGKVVPEVQCKIGADGEILVSGATVLKGYLDGIGDHENKIREGNTIWHRTGDGGYLDEQNRLWLLGRISQEIHDHQGTLYPFCVECILDAHFGIRGAILAADNERMVVIEKGVANPEEVLQLLKPQQITQVITVKKLPMEKRHGAKIDYAKLMELFRNNKK